MLDLATGTGVIPIKAASEKLGEPSNHRSQTHHTNKPFRIHGLDITMSMLARARKKMAAGKVLDQIDLVCASAMDIPYAGESFELVTCALATHHMDVSQLLAETWRILQAGGRLSIADVGGSSLWKLPVIKFLLRIAAFVYFLLKENIHRAWAEVEAVSNVRSKEEWSDLLNASGFQDIKITKLKSKHRWVPEPLVIQAVKPIPGGSR
jgi:ubiquinone/menaquinone biosynthesis C-methylase UbiE